MAAIVCCFCYFIPPKRIGGFGCTNLSGGSVKGRGHSVHLTQNKKSSLVDPTGVPDKQPHKISETDQVYITM